MCISHDRSSLRSKVPICRHFLNSCVVYGMYNSVLLLRVHRRDELIARAGSACVLRDFFDQSNNGEEQFRAISMNLIIYAKATGNVYSARNFEYNIKDSEMRMTKATTPFHLMIVCQYSFSSM